MSTIRSGGAISARPAVRSRASRPAAKRDASSDAFVVAVLTMLATAISFYDVCVLVLSMR